MKKYILFILFTGIVFSVKAQIVNIPDANFKDALVNSNCVDSNGDGIPDRDVDTNDDGEIQLSEADDVLSLEVYERNINSLEGISSFGNLEMLNCGLNLLASLDLSQNPALIELRAQNNEDLTYLNLKNGNNTSIVSFSAIDNPSLFCIEVDDPAYSNSNLNWNKDVTAVYSEDCENLNANDFNSSDIEFFPNPATDALYVVSNDLIIKTIKVYTVLGKTITSYIMSDDNRLDISGLPAGIYFLEVIGENGSLAKRFIKK
ncbi:MAG: hypothetical protein ACI884_002237 [Ulvibacter sp.]|jgi:hypothetical protein